MGKKSVSHAHMNIRKVLNYFILKSIKKNKRKPLYKTDEIAPEFIEFEENYEEIKSEILNFIDENKITKYSDIDPARAKEVSLDWKLYYIKLFKKNNLLASSKFPKLLKISNKYANIISIAIALLDPGVELAPHKGPYMGILRYHLGIKVPKNSPPYIRVSNEYYTWREGDGIVIDDCFEHEVINKSDSIRVILIIDFYRKLPFFVNSINKFYLSTFSMWSRIMIKNANK